MAKVVWEEEAERVFEQYVENAYFEFGKSTASRWLEERLAKEWRLAHFPDSYPPEELLNAKKKFYRRYFRRGNKSSLREVPMAKVVWEEEAEDTVYIVDVWDTRMNPRTLIRRIK